jgi:hypothetical protein
MRQEGRLNSIGNAGWSLKTQPRLVTQGFKINSFNAHTRVDQYGGGVTRLKGSSFKCCSLLKLQNGSHDCCPVTRVEPLSIKLIKTSYS